MSSFHDPFDFFEKIAFGDVLALEVAAIRRLFRVVVIYLLETVVERGRVVVRFFFFVPFFVPYC